MSTKRASWLQDLAWRIEAIFYDLFVFVIRALPVDTASDLGGWLLKTIGPITPIQTLVKRNLELAFPEQDETWKSRVIKAQWDNVGRTFAEFAIMDRIRIDNGRVIVENIERLHEISQNKQPVVFISGHFANWEVMPAVIVDSGVDCLMTYRAANNPYVDERIRHGRARYGVKLFAPKGGDGAKELLVGMGKGQSVALMNDQKFNRGVVTPFFGHEADTAPGPTRLAQKFGAPLQLMTVERLHKARFKVKVHSPFTVIDKPDRALAIEATVCQISALIEAQVRAKPEEWFWVHKRWPNRVYSEIFANKQTPNANDLRE